MQPKLTSHEAGILTRLVAAKTTALSSSAARGLLSLTFSPADQERMHLLTEKSRAGTLSNDELAEVEAYGRMSSFLGILKSKARVALKRRNGKAKSA